MQEYDTTGSSSRMSPLVPKKLLVRGIGGSDTCYPSVIFKGKSSITNISDLPDVCLHRILEFFVCEDGIDKETFSNFQLLNKSFRSLSNSSAVWYRIPLVLRSGHININAMQYIKQKSAGTEGTCYHMFSRSWQVGVALKRARVFPDNEGVPYYMIRELSALKVATLPLTIIVFNESLIVLEGQPS